MAGHSEAPTFRDIRPAGPTGAHHISEDRRARFHARRRPRPSWLAGLLLLTPCMVHGSVLITFNPEPPARVSASAGSVGLTIVVQAQSTFETGLDCAFGIFVAADAAGQAQESDDTTVVVPAGTYGPGDTIDSGSITININDTFREAEGFSVGISDFTDSCGGDGGYQVEADFEPRFVAISQGLGDREGLTDRQRRVAGALANACAALQEIPEDERTPRQNDLVTICDAAAAADEPGAIYDGLAPEEVAAQGRAGLQSMRQQLQNISTRVGELRAGATGFSTGGLAIALHGEQLPVRLIGNALGGGAGDDFLAFSRWGLFVNGSASFGSRERTDNEPGFRSKSFGLTAGIAYRFTPETVAGVALGLTRTDSDLRANAGGVDVDGYSLSLYGTHFLPNAFYVDGIVTIGYNRYDTVRTLFSDPNGQNARASPRGTEYALGLNAGYDHASGPWTASLQAGLAYVRVEIDSYTERPSNPNNPGTGAMLAIDSQSIESKTAEAAVQLTYAASHPWGVMLYTGRWGVEREFSHDSRRINARFVEDPTGSTFALRTDAPDRIYVNIGAGITAQMARGRAAYVFFESVEGISGYSLYHLDLGFRMEF
ncbi:MAG: autotransporter outer membrane beta-barrel domain-containing protein [Ectothiorhodospiraceae bacterium]|nr:autotransporter outer membrane beta-barrel domain-containing protein [Ectothiorhodospiraceae bacterium]